MIRNGIGAYSHRTAMGFGPPHLLSRGSGLPHGTGPSEQGSIQVYNNTAMVQVFKPTSGNMNVRLQQSAH